MERDEFLDKIEKFYLTPAREIMSHDFPAVKRDEPIRRVIREISKQSVDHLWVVDSNNKVIGIITEKDLLDGIKEPLFGEDIAWDTLEIRSLLYRDVKTAEDMMTSRLFKCEPDTRLKEIVKLMVDNRIRHLPVIEDGLPVGEITIDQIIKLVDKEFFD
ncbi:MAG TPA: CBS domain-containing protein [Candidatus Altiarchaeales archaeon]|nr:CBS domain-containing protein [Candidatus Altiarchaeales archaeon]